MNINVILSVAVRKQYIEVPLSIPKGYDIKSILDYANLYNIFPETILLEPTVNGRNKNTNLYEIKNNDRIILCAKLVCTPQNIRRIKQNRIRSDYPL